MHISNRRNNERLHFYYSNMNSEKFVCKESFWWDGFEIIPPRPKLGLLSAFSNRAGGGGDDDSESIVSDESTTEEFTEEETISSASLGSDEGSAESNPSPKKPIVRKVKKTTEGKLLWQHNLSARSNQDIQRAYEEGMLKEITTLLNRRTLNDNMARSSKHTGRNSAPIGGIWMRLESEWRESLNQKDIQSKAKIMPANRPNKPRSRF